ANTLTGYPVRAGHGYRRTFRPGRSRAGPASSYLPPPLAAPRRLIARCPLMTCLPWAASLSYSPTALARALCAYPVARLGRELIGPSLRHLAIRAGSSRSVRVAREPAPAAA